MLQEHSQFIHLLNSSPSPRLIFDLCFIIHVQAIQFPDCRVEREQRPNENNPLSYRARAERL
jgi:hypothetical protein